MAKKAETKNTETTSTALSVADRFTMSVLKAYGDVAKGIEVTDKEKKLIANYFIKIDEQLRNSKQGYNWGMVRMNEFALTLAHTAKLGLDMSLPNMLSFIPFKHGDTGTINMVPVIGKSGYEYIAKTFGLNPPKNIFVELVYSTDKFTMVKRDVKHPCDDYTFEITSPFNRGEIVGAFGYLAYSDKSNNFIMVKSKDELMRYRPPKYDPTFWSGENLPKMLEKTMAKQLLKKVALDPQKVNRIRDSFNVIDAADIEIADYMAKEEIAENMGQGDYIDVDAEPVEEAKQAETTETSNRISSDEFMDMFGEVMER